MYIDYFLMASNSKHMKRIVVYIWVQPQLGYRICLISLLEVCPNGTAIEFVPNWNKKDEWFMV